MNNPPPAQPAPQPDEQHEWREVECFAAVEEYFRRSLIDPEEIAQTLDSLRALLAHLEEKYSSARFWAQWRKTRRSPRRGDDRRDSSNDA